MELRDGLIIGIDIQNNISQVCYYDEKTKDTTPVVFADQKPVFRNPVELNVLYQKYAQGGVIEIDALAGLISYLIESVKRVTKRTKIAKICITVSEFSIAILDALKAVMVRMEFAPSQWIFISHEESYAYYAYSQHRELYITGVMLLDYEKEGLYTHLMTSIRKNGYDIILEENRAYENDVIVSAAQSNLGINEIENTLIECIQKSMGDKNPASIYLTGPGFDTGEFSNTFTHFLCNRRKAFAGKNLYVKGACYCAYEEVYNKVFDHIILACHHRITTGIEVDILERGIKKRFRIVKPGTNWYMAGRKMDFIIEDIRQIRLVMKPCNSAEEYEELIDISEIPYREGKTTRIRMEISFTADDRCLVTIKDRGFGDFVKSSNRVIYKEIELS
jgi:hypothetical protein